MQEAITQQALVLPPVDSLEYEITVLTSAIIEMDSADIWQKRDAHFFKDTEIDSLLSLEILASVEKQYQIEVPEERFPEITTLTNIIKLVRSLQMVEQH
jgi:acyl carrier protein